MSFDAQRKGQGACLLKSGASSGDQAVAKKPDLIFAFELASAVSALWSLWGTSPGASVVVHIDNASASQVLATGGPNHSWIDYLVGAFWFLADRESLSIWLERVSSASNPADAPSRGETSPVVISGERALPALREIVNLSPRLNLDSLERRETKSR